MKVCKYIFIRLFNKMFCRHKWELYHISRVYDDFDDIKRIDHTFICKKCGKFKKVTL